MQIVIRLVVQKCNALFFIVFPPFKGFFVYTFLSVAKVVNTFDTMKKERTYLLFASSRLILSPSVIVAYLKNDK
uniref:Uncharacterized protein n=1 Tax=Caenorhabditis japonica TaxID=281687 RepID=A0A8R1EMD9_CAEJA